MMVFNTSLEPTLSPEDDLLLDFDESGLCQKELTANQLWSLEMHGVRLASLVVVSKLQLRQRTHHNVLCVQMPRSQIVKHLAQLNRRILAL